MLTGYNFYRIHHSLNLHFTSNFDVLKYGNKSKVVSLASYDKRKDRGRFETFATKAYNDRTAFHLCVANFVHNEEGWLYRDYSEAEAIYTEWKAYFQAFEYKFKNEYYTLTGVMNERKIEFSKMLVETPSGNNPPLMQLLVRGKLSPEFVCTLNTQFSFIDHWYELVERDPYLERQIFTLKKYGPLCKLIAKEVRGQL